MIRIDPLQGEQLKADATVGIVGLGYVGSAVQQHFARAMPVKTYDKPKNIGDIRDVAKADLIFICVPTPQRAASGACDTSIIDEVVAGIAANAGKPPLLIVKSTIPVGYMETLQTRYPAMRFLFSPEFLTEKNAANDFNHCNRVIFGGTHHNAIEAAAFYRTADPSRWVGNARTQMYCLPFRGAEMVKLMGNAFLMTKVLFANEMYNLCQAAEIDYNAVRYCVALDSRIGPSHLLVPGPDGKHGAGGTCFPKDMASLINLFEEYQVSQRVLTAVAARNADLRGDL